MEVFGMVLEVIKEIFEWWYERLSLGSSLCVDVWYI